MTWLRAKTKFFLTNSMSALRAFLWVIYWESSNKKPRVNSRPLQFSKKTRAAAHALFPTDRTIEDRDHLLSPRICDGRAFATIPRSISFFMNNVYGVCSQGKIFRYIRCSWKWNQHFSSCDIHYYIFALLCISNVQELWYLFCWWGHISLSPWSSVRQFLTMPLGVIFNNVYKWGTLPLIDSPRPRPK